MAAAPRRELSGAAALRAAFTARKPAFVGFLTAG
jgi:tryptophan synthase alpha subunit